MASLSVRFPRAVKGPEGAYGVAESIAAVKMAYTDVTCLKAEDGSFYRFCPVLSILPK
jgi:hypothetical protein